MTETRWNYNHTLYASYLGYVCQAIVNNLAPLLFLTLQRTYGISLGQITLLVTFNFGVQLLVDLASTLFVDRLGYRLSSANSPMCAVHWGWPAWLCCRSCCPILMWGCWQRSACMPWAAG